MYDLLVKNGNIVLAEGTFTASIAVKEGKVAALLGGDEHVEACVTLDAAGLLVFPGLIDAHMHVQAPFQGLTGQLTFYQQSVCAAFSGVTTFMDFTNSWKGGSVVQALDARIAEMAESCIDYGVHGKFVEATPAVLREIPELARKGCPTFKLFMTYRKEGVMADDDTLLQVFRMSADHGCLPLIHAESNAIAEYNSEACLAAGRLSWRDFARAKPVLCETEAFGRAVHLAEAAASPVLIVHTTNGPCLDIAERAQSRGLPVYVETCPHYLTVFDDLYDNPKNGHLGICSPPLRTPTERDALWRGIQQGVVSLVGSDDCTYSRQEKEAFLEKDPQGELVQDFTKVVNGVSGLETRLAVMATDGVAQGRISYNQLVALCSSNVAKRMGCYPQKGTLMPGADADIVLFDPQEKWKISPHTLHNGAGYTLLDGYQAQGKVTTTIARGKIIMKNGIFTGEKGAGRYVHRTL